MMNDTGNSAIKDTCEYFVVGVKHGKRAVVSYIPWIPLFVEELEDALFSSRGELVVREAFSEYISERIYHKVEEGLVEFSS